MEAKKAESGKSIIRNVLFGLSTWVLPLGLSFVATPILIRALGDADYGIYALVLGFIGYSFNLSLGRAITKYIAEFRISGEDQKIREVISATLFLNITIGLTGVLAIFLSAGWLVSDVFKIEEAARTKTVYSLYLASGIIFLTMMGQVFSAALQGLHRFDIYSKIFNINGFTLIIGNITLALNGYGLIALLGWNLGVSGLICILNLIYARRLLPEMTLSLRFKRETLRLVLKFSAGIIGYQILANVLLLFERGWITRFLGAEGLTYYVVPLTLSLYIHSFIGSMIIVLFPLASELNDNIEKLKNLYTKATKIVCLLVVFMGMTLIVQSHFFLNLWLGGEFAERSGNILIVHTVTFSLLAILTVSWQMTEGLGHPGFNFKIYWVCAFLFVGFMFGLTGPLGGLGVAIARLIGFGTMCFSVFYVERWFFGHVQKMVWLRIVTILAAASLAGAVCEKLVIGNFQYSWLTLIGSVGAGGIVYLLIVWIFGYLDAGEKRMVRSILTR